MDLRLCNCFICQHNGRVHLGLRLPCKEFILELALVPSLTSLPSSFLLFGTPKALSEPRFLIFIGLTYAITFGLYVYHRQESKNPLFSFQRKYANPYDAPIDPRETAETDQPMFKDQGEDAAKVSLEDVVEGEYDYTG